MPRKTPEQLTALSPPLTTDLIVSQRPPDPESKKITIADLTTLIAANHTHTLASLGAAAVGGSSSQGFAASVLYVSSYAGLSHTSYTGQVIPWLDRVDIHGALRVRNPSETAYDDVWAKDYYANEVKVASDERLKRNIREFTKDSGVGKLTKLAKAGVIRFNLLTDEASEPERTGLSAQAVAQCIPEAMVVLPSEPPPGGKEIVEPAEEDRLMGWSLPAMIAVLVDAVATLDARLDALEKKNTAKA